MFVTFLTQFSQTVRAAEHHPTIRTRRHTRRPDMLTNGVRLATGETDMFRLYSHSMMALTLSCSGESVNLSPTAVFVRYSDSIFLGR
jgi:hypothetical protein